MVLRVEELGGWFGGGMHHILLQHELDDGLGPMRQSRIMRTTRIEEWEQSTAARAASRALRFIGSQAELHVILLHRHIFLSLRLLAYISQETPGSEHT